MIVFQKIRTNRLNVCMREMTIGDAIYLCKLPSGLYETGTTELLNRIIDDEKKPFVGQITDVRKWTVQERALAVAHYLLHTGEGDPDFKIGEGKLSDYLNMDIMDCPQEIDLGDICGDKWFISPLLGIHAESIERLISMGSVDGARHGWWMAAMSAVMRREKEAPLGDVSDAQLDDHISGRVKVFSAYPESDFIKLLYAFLNGMARLDHLFKIDFIDDGIVWLPAKKEGQGLPPARFLFSSAVSEPSYQIFGKYDRDGG